MTSTEEEGRTAPPGRGLIVDFGGVLTSSVARSFREFERAEGLPKGTVFAIVADAYRHHDGDNPIVAFEVGASTADEFGRAMAAELRSRGFQVTDEGLAARLFAATSVQPAMWRLVRRAREAGVRTAMLSNSWGTEGYPRDLLDEHFDAVVLSGEVGLRKPDPRIFELAAARLDLPPSACAFVDDLERNVIAARELGMFAVHHHDAESTARALSTFLGTDLTAALDGVS